MQGWWGFGPSFIGTATVPDRASTAQFQVAVPATLVGDGVEAAVCVSLPAEEAATVALEIAINGEYRARSASTVRFVYYTAASMAAVRIQVATRERPRLLHVHCAALALRTTTYTTIRTTQMTMAPPHLSAVGRPDVRGHRGQPQHHGRRS